MFVIIIIRVPSRDYTCIFMEQKLRSNAQDKGNQNVDVCDSRRNCLDRSLDSEMALPKVQNTRNFKTSNRYVPLHERQETPNEQG